MPSKLGNLKISQCADHESWLKVRHILCPDDRVGEIDAIIVVPPWIDGKGASVIGLNVKEATDE